jgi:Arc/MetJ-type ribon-helix-helix transcriptional regulator
MRSLTVRLPEPTHELVSELRERMQLESAGEVVRRAIEALDAAQR